MPLSTLRIGTLARVLAQVLARGGPVRKGRRCPEGRRAQSILVARAIPATTHMGQPVMTTIHETAYPRIRSNLSDKELEEIYTPTSDDLACIHRLTKSTVAAFGGVVLLKTFQRLGYFPSLDALPPHLIHHLATARSVLRPHLFLQQYEQRRLREWHVPQIRDHLGITAFSAGGRRVLVGSLLEAAQSQDILADLINAGLEALVETRYELPAFSTLQRAAQKARAQVNYGYYKRV